MQMPNVKNPTKIQQRATAYNLEGNISKVNKPLARIWQIILKKKILIENFIIQPQFTIRLKTWKLSVSTESLTVEWRLSLISGPCQNPQLLSLKMRIMRILLTITCIGIPLTTGPCQYAQLLSLKMRIMMMLLTITCIGIPLTTGPCRYAQWMDKDSRLEMWTPCSQCSPAQRYHDHHDHHAHHAYHFHHVHNAVLLKGTTTTINFHKMYSQLYFQPFTYAVCLNELGNEIVHQYVGQVRETIHFLFFMKTRKYRIFFRMKGGGQWPNSNHLMSIYREFLLARPDFMRFLKRSKMFLSS